MARHVHRAFGGDDVRRDQQQAAFALGAAEGVVLAEHAAGQEREHQPGLHTRATSQDRPERPALLRQRAPGQRAEPGGGRAHPAGAVDDLAGQQREVEAQVRQLPDVPLGLHGQLTQVGDGGLGLRTRNLRTAAHEQRAGLAASAQSTMGRVSVS